MSIQLSLGLRQALKSRGSSLLKSFAIPIACIGLTACGGGGTGAQDPLNSISQTYTEYSRSTMLQALGLRAIHEQGYTGTGTIVAIIDTGINAEHKDLIGQIHASSVSATEGDSLADLNGHGTSLAGIIGALANEEGIIGMAPDTKLLVVKADLPDSPGSIYNSAVANGLRLAADLGADVINLSLGNVVSSTYDDIHYATDAGSIVVIATGNDGLNGQTSGAAYDIAQFGGAGIAVTALDGNQIAGYATPCNIQNPQFCLAAPGTNIMTTSLSGGYHEVSGTSAATAVVSGSMAVLKSFFPDLTNEDLVEIILLSADDLGEVGVDEIYGAGAINLEAAMQPIGTLTLSYDSEKHGLDASLMSLGSAAHITSLAALLGVDIQDAYARDYQADLTALVRDNHSRLELIRNRQTTIELSGIFGSDMSMNYYYTGAYSDTSEAVTGFSMDLETTSGVQIFAGFVPLAALEVNQQNIARHIFSEEESLSFARLDYNLSDTTRLHGSFYAHSDSKTYGASLGLSKSTKASRLSFDLNLMHEDETSLGTNLQGAFGTIDHASTVGVSLGYSKSFGAFQMFGDLSLSKTTTQLAQTGLVSHYGGLTASAGRVGIVGRSIWAANDQMQFTISKPLKVTSGSITLNDVITSMEAPRETIEASLMYQAPLGLHGQWEIGAKYRRNANPLMADEKILGLQVSIPF